jgi:hypothetical protein
MLTAPLTAGAFSGHCGRPRRGAGSSDSNPLLKIFGESGKGLSLGDAQPFEYVPDAVSDDVMDLAATTNNPRYAAKVLGYDQNAFSDMIHAMKDENRLRPNDNVIWHDNGDVYFKGVKNDNMHSY